MSALKRIAIVAGLVVGSWAVAILAMWKAFELVGVL